MSRYPGRGIHGITVSDLGLRIIAGTYPPGTLIDPEALQLELGVSKTVIREALRVLCAKGLTDSRPKRGTFVRDREEWNLLDTDVMLWRREADTANDTLLEDLSEARLLLEPASVRIAAARRTEAELAELDDTLSAMEAAAGDADLNIDADLRFHLLLLKATHNELLTRMDVVIINALGARDRIVHQPGKEWRSPVPDHRRVLDAVRRQDPDAASEAMCTLLRDSDEDTARY